MSGLISLFYALLGTTDVFSLQIFFIKLQSVHVRDIDLCDDGSVLSVLGLVGLTTATTISVARCTRIQKCVVLELE
jgi:hypothetical protein